MKLIGAVDIGGTKIAVGAVRQNGTVMHRSECATDPARGFHDAILRICRMLHEAIDACGPFVGIGIACPGPHDPFTGVIGNVGTLPTWEGCNLIEALKTDFQVPVAMENDADAAALAEFNWGAAHTSESFIYITVSTGIGCGVVLGGKLYRGVEGTHPEIGHQILDASGPLCYCGARGCWESFASGTAMSAWFREMAPEAGPITAAEICERAQTGDELAMRAVQREGFYLGLGLANLITIFAPEGISLGGGVMKSAALFLDDARKVVSQLCTQVPAEKTKIVLASLGSDTGLLGAAQSWLQRYP